MMLARMRAADEAALICDFAETYHVLDYKALPVRTAAVLAAGLRDDSRIKMIMAGERISQAMMIEAIQADELRYIAWTKTKDAKRNRNRPKPILETLLGEQKTAKETLSFRSGEAFEAAWRGVSNG